jgi:CRISPR-associated protein Cas1
VVIITKPLELTLNKYGEYLGVKGQSFEVRNKNGSREIPFHKVKRAILSSGNLVSTSALFWLATYGIDTVFTSKTGKVISIKVPYEADTRADIRVKQYQAYQTPRGVAIANQIIENRLRSQQELLIVNDINSDFLDKYLNRLPIKGEKVDIAREDFLGLEGNASRYYFREYMKMFPDWIRPKMRKNYKTRDPLNNLLNLGHELLKREVYIAIVNTHLDPYLGYLHSPQLAKPSLVYDLMERFRSVVEQFVIDYHTQVSESCFELKGRRVFLKRDEERCFFEALSERLDKRMVYIRRNNSKTTKIRTAIKEESSLLVKYLLNDERSLNFIKE